MEKRLCDKLTIIILIIIIIALGVILIKSEIDSDKLHKKQVVEEYEKCLAENFNQRYDCARIVSNYSYQYLDQLRKSF